MRGQVRPSSARRAGQDALLLNSLAQVDPSALYQDCCCFQDLVHGCGCLWCIFDTLIIINTCSGTCFANY